MGFLPFTKLFISFIALTVISVFLKWSVDVCLPDYDHGHIFPKAISLPQAVCSPVMKWDLWARDIFRAPEIASNWYVRNSSVLKSPAERNEEAVIDIAKNVLGVTLLLEKIPKDGESILKFLAVLVGLTILSAMIWRLVEILITYPRQLQEVLTSAERQRRRL
ncbi:MAG: hypothetical protein IT291_02340 [Deltaproteobacteria bacterium]|nr:hypothetical protein [Deltaproteobacteria bacterium]